MDDNQIASFIRSDAAPPAADAGVTGSQSPGAGHNHPPSPISVDSLLVTLAEGHGDLTTRRDTLVGSLGKYLTVEDDEGDAKTTDFIGLMTSLFDTADERHTVEKKPYLEGGRIVDGFFNAIRGPLTDAIKKAKKASVDYKVKKHDAEVAEQQRIARLAREEEQRKIAAAAEAEAKIKGEKTMERAIVAETVATQATEIRIVAEAAAQAVVAKPQAATMIHGVYGTTSSLSFGWAHRVTDLSKVPTQYLMLNEAAITAHIKARPNKGEAPTAIAGIEFFKQPKGNFRK